MNTQNTSTGNLDLNALKRAAVIRMILGFSILGLVFIFTAGTIRYWEAWAYLVTIFFPMMIFGIYVFKHDPGLLERRMRTKEKRQEQKLIMKLGVLPYIMIYILPGLDKRWGWSDIPLFLKIIGLILVLTGYLWIIYVLKTNSYASRVIDVEEEQQVITTGPYARLRHPMYTGVMVMNGATPLLLGSWWAFIPVVLMIPVFVFRILDEEKELRENLAGYEEYILEVKRRMIPGIW